MFSQSYQFLFVWIIFLIIYLLLLLLLLLYCPECCLLLYCVTEHPCTMHLLKHAELPSLSNTSELTLPHVLFTSSRPWHSNYSMREKVSLLLIYLSTAEYKHDGWRQQQLDGFWTVSVTPCCLSVWKHKDCVCCCWWTAWRVVWLQCDEKQQ